MAEKASRTVVKSAKSLGFPGVFCYVEHSIWSVK
jgi:hypothetical protein